MHTSFNLNVCFVFLLLGAIMHVGIHEAVQHQSAVVSGFQMGRPPTEQRWSLDPRLRWWSLQALFPPPQLSTARRARLSVCVVARTSVELRIISAPATSRLLSQVIGSYRSKPNVESINAVSDSPSTWPHGPLVGFGRLGGRALV